MARIVMKFGGTSVGKPGRMQSIRTLITSDDTRKIVVLSALSGTTNDLLAIGESLKANDDAGANAKIDALKAHYDTFIGELYRTDSGKAAGQQAVDNEFAFIRSLTRIEPFTLRQEKELVAEGELLSTQLFQAYLTEEGVASVLLPALEFMRIDADNEPDIQYTEERLTEILSQHADKQIIVTQGFICRNPRGEVDNLKRGGSDYTASLIGAAIEATAIEIWTDVDGMLTADPRVVPGARPIEQIRFDEASELASFGAKVLHPATIAPAVRLGIPVWIYNSRNPGGHGTRITFDAPRRSVTAIAAKRDTTILRVATGRMLFQPGFLRRVFELFDEHSVSVDVVATSEVSVSVTVDDTAPLDVLLGALRQVGDVSVERRRAIISVVGSGIADDASAMGAVLRALGHRRIHMLSLSASAINLTILLDDADVPDAMRALHAALFEDVTP